jgi:Cu(I)/Ag(I) efflux system protein CusF
MNYRRNEKGNAMRKKIYVTARTLVLLTLLTSPMAWAQSTMIDGQVKKVDESSGKITIKHGPIKKFDMDEGMTMVFRAQDPTMLKTVKAGDKVKFEPERINGQFTITKIENRNNRTWCAGDSLTRINETSSRSAKTYDVTLRGDSKCARFFCWQWQPRSLRRHLP